MFRRTRQSAEPVGSDLIKFRFENREILAARGDSVAAALLAAGISDFRSSVVSGESRGPFCLIGNCFDCLVEIDGEPNQRSCQEPVGEGMQVRRQQGIRTARISYES
ncbi:MAG: (2Fe-2S)-binding protein [Gammaproteobacteria bacterium]|nr:(2Fe-2S)-binding protein [Gammaproteobacteria bacterium]